MAFSTSAFLSLLLSKLRLSKLPSTWKILAVVFALLNLKSLPLAWHFRLLYGIFLQVRASRRRIAQLPGPRTLFAPVITTSSTSLLECDYNIHKSNSTYFTDSDVGRLHLVVALCREGVDRVGEELEIENPGSGGLRVYLGGVSASFRREIRPLESYEVWTRILAWDKKWLYLVQHFVRKGRVKKGNYLLQNHRKEKTKGSSSDETKSKKEGNGLVDNPPHPAIYATIIAKYVFKHGRRTIPPERVLQASQLLPPKPEQEILESGDTNGHATLPAIATNGSIPDSSTLNGVATKHTDELLLRADGQPQEILTWDQVEKERARGMRMAEIYAKLDGLNDEFPGDGADILGIY